MLLVVYGGNISAKYLPSCGDCNWRRGPELKEIGTGKIKLNKAISYACCKKQPVYQNFRQRCFLKPLSHQAAQLGVHFWTSVFHFASTHLYERTLEEEE